LPGTQSQVAPPLNHEITSHVELQKRPESNINIEHLLSASVLTQGFPTRGIPQGDLQSFRQKWNHRLQIQGGGLLIS